MSGPERQQKIFICQKTIFGSPLDIYIHQRKQIINSDNLIKNAFGFIDIINRSKIPVQNTGLVIIIKKRLFNQKPADNTHPFFPPESQPQAGAGEPAF